MFSAKLLAREEYRWIADSILDVPTVLDPPHFLREFLPTSCSAHLHEAYSESCRTSKTELTAKIVID